jgi:hypothetical protein
LTRKKAVTALTEAEAAVAAAHQRLRGRALTLRADWHKVQTTCRGALTRPAMVGGVAVLGAVIGARSRSSPEGKGIRTPPSFLRILILAVVTPILKAAIGSAVRHLVAGNDARPVSDTPSTRDMTPGVTEAGT